MTNSSVTLNQFAAALSTYLTRRVATGVLLFVAVAVVLLLWLTGMSGADPQHKAMFAGNLLGMPVMGIVFFLVQQAKWQFVHPRARLLPNYAASHLTVNGLFLALGVGVYPLIVGLLMGIPILSTLAFSALFAALLAWGMQTMRQGFMLPAMAVFFSLLIPRVSWFWVTPDASLTPLRLVALLAGWAGLWFWLQRLAAMSEEGDDYLIPVQSQFGQASRMEKSEARRFTARMVTRGKLSGWIIDAWHDRLAGYSARTDADRRRLLRYGLTPTPVVMRVLFIVTLMTSIAGMQALMMGGSLKNAMPAVVIQMGIFTMMGPMIMIHFIAQRRARLGQELLLPMTRGSLVAGLLRAVTIETLWTFGAGILLVIVAAIFLAPQLLTPVNVTAAALGMISIQPLLVGASMRTGLVQSGIKRMILMLLVLYAVMIAVSGIVWAGIYGSLIYAALVSLALALLGWWSIRAARRKWLNAELG